MTNSRYRNTEVDGISVESFIVQLVSQAINVLRAPPSGLSVESALAENRLAFLLPENHWAPSKNDLGLNVKSLLLRAAQSVSPPRVFLNYARCDASKIKKIRDFLDSEGFGVWVDEEATKGGQDVGREIEIAIKKSHFFLACLSQTSVQRRGWIQRELKMALSRQDDLLPGDIYLIPVRLEDCDLPEQLTAYVCVDLYLHDGYQRLLDALRNGLKRREAHILFPADKKALLDLARWLLKEYSELESLARTYVLFSENEDEDFQDRVYHEHERTLSILAERSIARSDWRTTLLLTRGFCEYFERNHRLEEFERFAEFARTAASRLGDRSREVLHGAHVGWHHYCKGRLEQARSALEHALDRARGQQCHHETALASRTLALVLLESGLLDDAERNAQEALRLWNDLGDLRWIARAEGLIGLIALERGNDWPKARKFLTRARSRNRGISPEGMVMNLVDLSEMCRRQGNLKEARRYLEEALPSAEKGPIHDRYAYALMHWALLTVSLSEADLKSALRSLDEAREIYAKGGRSIMEQRVSRWSELIRRILGHMRGESKPISIPLTAQETGPTPSLSVFLEEYRDSEPLRRESPDHYVAHAPLIFESVASNGERKPPPPLCVQLEITNTCSTSCKMCLRWNWDDQEDRAPSESGGSEKRRPLETSEIIDLLTELSTMRGRDSTSREGVQSVVFSGGEPVIHRDFARILSHSRQSGLHVGILSNGIWGDRDIAGAIVENADWIRLSIDGSTPTVYDRVRQPMPGFEGGLVAVERTLAGLAQAKRQLGRNEFRIAIAYTIQKNNIDDVESMVRFAERCSHLRDEPGPVVVFKIAHGSGKFLCDEKQLAEFEEKILGNEELLYNERANLRYIKTYFDLMSREDIARGEPLRTYYRNDNFTCFTPYLFSLIDAFGDVFVCCHLYDDNGRFHSEARTGSSLGNVQRRKFSDVWTSSRYGDARAGLLKINVDKMPMCAQCTRHFRPNTVMTDIYDTVYKSHLSIHGEEEGKHSFRKIAAAHRPEVIWF